MTVRGKHPDIKQLEIVSSPAKNDILGEPLLLQTQRSTNGLTMKQRRIAHTIPRSLIFPGGRRKTTAMNSIMSRKAKKSTMIRTARKA
jgi:hypothetical protein